MEEREIKICYKISREMLRGIRYKYMLKILYVSNIKKIIGAKLVKIIGVLVVCWCARKFLEIVGDWSQDTIMIAYVNIVMVIGILFSLVGEEILLLNTMLKFKAKFKKQIVKGDVDTLFVFDKKGFTLNRAGFQQKIPFTKVYETKDILYLAEGLLPLEKSKISAKDLNDVKQLCYENTIYICE